MIRIAVCDDEEVMCGQLKQMIASRLEQWQESFRITCWTSTTLAKPANRSRDPMHTRKTRTIYTEDSRQNAIKSQMGMLIVPEAH